MLSKLRVTLLSPALEFFLLGNVPNTSEDGKLKLKEIFVHAGKMSARGEYGFIFPRLIPPNLLNYCFPFLLTGV